MQTKKKCEPKFKKGISVIKRVVWIYFQFHRTVKMNVLKYAEEFN